MFKKTLMTGVICLSSLSACAAFAQDNAIRFLGSVSSQTCNISVNNSTVASPSITYVSAVVIKRPAAGQFIHRRSVLSGHPQLGQMPG